MSNISEGITHLKQDEAINVDVELMGPLGFSVDQLMELAGLSCACSVAEVYPRDTHPRVLILAGPGNNGGDGLVAARHLKHFGYKPTICYPKPTDKPLYNGLVTQCRSLQIEFISADDLLKDEGNGNYFARECDVVLDALFGFSFQGAPRPPFAAILQALSPSASPPPIASVDIPSGWQVEDGDVDGNGIRPDMLISLTAPKECSRKFEGAHHFLGGRFVPPEIAEKYHLVLPEYPGTSMCVRIPSQL
ncbi:pyridoxine/pyridoxamine 5'-phosphate oxidase [Cymbomonas tetramitiformis]|uniref:NAD(P)H-hydrate epimerase n=1 Tax=Cymbomonas tetramitiformis TaxID=36881 RepID=A0AAE0L5Z5_9CHLO|nr:pyridoxine/pyridoxamine 5'-phosphate oxidase [Cymbomonas tetramitiformis]